MTEYRRMSTPSRSASSRAADEGRTEKPTFFSQADDGIRAPLVTGVQTCALPISECARPRRECRPAPAPAAGRPRCRARSDRKSVVEGKSVDLGGRRSIKKKK